MSVCCCSQREAAQGTAADLSITINREMSLPIMETWDVAFSEKPLINPPQAAVLQCSWRTLCGCCRHWFATLILALWRMCVHLPKAAFMSPKAESWLPQTSLWISTVLYENHSLGWYVRSAKCQLESAQRAYASAKTAEKSKRIISAAENVW